MNVAPRPMPVAGRGDGAAVQLDQRLGQRQAQAQAAPHARRARIALRETLEQPGPGVGLEPESGVADADLKSGVAAFERDVGVPALRA